MGIIKDREQALAILHAAAYEIETRAIKFRQDVDDPDAVVVYLNTLPEQVQVYLAGQGLAAISGRVIEVEQASEKARQKADSDVKHILERQEVIRAVVRALSTMTEDSPAVALGDEDGEKPVNDQ